MSVTLTIKQKKSKFDRRVMVEQIGKDNARAMNKMGAFVRRNARSKLRRRKKSAAPGQPPSVHSSHKVATLKNIQFAYDQQTLSTVVGPMPFESRSLESNSEGTGAGLQERGGQAVFRQRRASRNGRPRPKRVATFAKHPFIGPAGEEESKKFPSLWVGK
jgi:hypothetical protein